MNCVPSVLVVLGLLFAVVIGCSNQRNSNSVASSDNGNATNISANANNNVGTSSPSATVPNGNSKTVTKQTAESAFRVPADSVPAVQITLDFDDKRSDIKAGIGKWRHKRVTFHGTVFTFEKGDNGNFKISLAGHDSFFTVFCKDIPASQAGLVGKLKEDETVIAITGIILGNGITGLVPGHVDHDVIAEKCKIVE